MLDDDIHGDFVNGLFGVLLGLDQGFAQGGRIERGAGFVGELSAGGGHGFGRDLGRGSSRLSGGAGGNDIGVDGPEQGAGESGQEFAAGESGRFPA